MKGTQGVGELGKISRSVRRQITKESTKPVHIQEQAVLSPTKAWPSRFSGRERCVTGWC
jgi:hypothetical protein